jgi:hypothetical protein
MKRIRQQQQTGNATVPPEWIEAGQRQDEGRTDLETTGEAARTDNAIEDRLR